MSASAKKFYDTKAAASIAVAHCQNIYDKPMHAYQCSFGDHWHVTSTLQEDRHKKDGKYYVCYKCNDKVRRSRKLDHELKHKRIREQYA